MEHAILGGGFTFVLALMGIVYATINKATSDNSEEIKNIKEKYVTKEDFNRQNDKVDAKLDKILDILMGSDRR